ncbi:MAG: 30S ribosomal protein S2 [Calditrichaeota bacterium]|nr:30S ribosomal protein S2 [Calditrichota bacterium]MCB9366388.1 30S ribosomal protein S2 [Calditrichota bacterium]MCB9391982.1 30S ribosomal protein S2 [Calditrichota bacterium]
MSRVTLQQLLLAGAHFGHLTRRWHPKMAPYILMDKNGIHLVDLRQTQTALETACAAVSEFTANGQQLLMVGTKSQAREAISSEGKRAQTPFVVERWLGGMLTNFATIRQGVKNMEAIERMMSDGTFEKISKKERLMKQRQHEKMMHTLGGIRDMRHLPGAIFVVDILREKIAVAEARRLGIPVIAICDTNVDPTVVDFPIPANDDAFKSIALITRAIAEAAIEGSARYKANADMRQSQADVEARELEATGEARRRERDRGRPGDRPDQGGPQRRRRVRRPEDQKPETASE